MKRFWLAGDFTLSPLRVESHETSEITRVSVVDETAAATRGQRLIRLSLSCSASRGSHHAYVHKLRAGWMARQSVIRVFVWVPKWAWRRDKGAQRGGRDKGGLAGGAAAGGLRSKNTLIFATCGAYCGKRASAVP